MVKYYLVRMDLADHYNNRFKINSTRLANWDYGSNASYFVTICTGNKQPYFGEIIQAEHNGDNIASLQATPLGVLASQYWEDITKHFSFVELDDYIIMPDHIHGILLFNNPDARSWQPNKPGPQSGNLGSVIRGFKAGVKGYATRQNLSFEWQPRFYDRVIRNADELTRIRKYIQDNPAKWSTEKGNPENLYR